MRQLSADVDYPCACPLAASLRHGTVRPPLGLPCGVECHRRARMSVVTRAARGSIPRRVDRSMHVAKIFTKLTYLCFGARSVRRVSVRGCGCRVGPGEAVLPATSHVHRAPVSPGLRAAAGARAGQAEDGDTTAHGLLVSDSTSSGPTENIRSEETYNSTRRGIEPRTDRCSAVHGFVSVRRAPALRMRSLRRRLLWRRRRMLGCGCSAAALAAAATATPAAAAAAAAAAAVASAVNAAAAAKLRANRASLYHDGAARRRQGTVGSMAAALAERASSRRRSFSSFDSGAGAAAFTKAVTVTLWSSSSAGPHGTTSGSTAGTQFSMPARSKES